MKTWSTPTQVPMMRTHLPPATGTFSTRYSGTQTASAFDDCKCLEAADSLKFEIKRAKKNWTQAEVSMHIGISKQGLNSIQNWQIRSFYCACPADGESV